VDPSGPAYSQESKAMCDTELNRRFPHPRGRGYTLVEVLITFAIMLVLTSLILVGLTGLVRNARLQGERQTLRSMGMGVEQFTRSFGFVPPLVDDASTQGALEQDPVTGTFRARLRGVSATDDQGPDRYLRYETAAHRGAHWSVLSLPYFLLGTLGESVDGVSELGMTRPQADGSFARRGEEFEPLYDMGANPERLKRRTNQQRLVVDANEQLTIVDRWGTEIRFYRWAPTFHQNVAAPLAYAGAPPNDPARAGQVRSYSVPPGVGSVTTNPALRSARWAIVSSGPDGRSDESFADSPLNKDNIVILEGAQ
jgi:type II secretory pathway pseudopilin PulG